MSAPEPDWLTPPQLSAWIPVGAVLLALPSALDSQLQRDAGLSYFSYLVMAGLSQAPERTIPMSELAALANGSLSRLSHTVRKLEREGWVRRSPMPANGRITLATLTDAGLAKIACAAPGHVAEVRRLVVDVLGADELARLGDASRTMLATLFGPDHPALLRKLEA